MTDHDDLPFKPPPVTLRAPNLFQTGRFRLHSGGWSGVKIDVDALTDADLATLAEVAAPRVGPFCKLVAIPRGGRRLAAALERYLVRGFDRPEAGVLVVDDVLTTGASMLAELARQRGNVGQLGRPVRGLVIFARELVPPDVTAIFTTSIF